MKTVLFVPGFHEDILSRDYKSVLDAIGNKGYSVKFVPIQWKHTTVDDWRTELSQEYKKYDPQQTILAGFSYGAMTAFLLAVEKNPYELWLFSLLPYFAEDIPKMRQAWLNIIGKRRTESFKTLTFDDRAEFVKCKTLLFTGELEARKYSFIGERSDSAHKKIKDSQLIEGNGVGHDVAHSNYGAAIKAAI